ncbi:hypothetical protein BZA77DRAFT_79583 [Pyronema omphalodes]|nr:hypothetical protein BZA77DRAFT_79583 [Pyronema omphalodes]
MLDFFYRRPPSPTLRPLTTSNSPLSAIPRAHLPQSPVHSRNYIEPMLPTKPTKSTIPTASRSPYKASTTSSAVNPTNIESFLAKSPGSKSSDSIASSHSDITDITSVDEEEAESIKAPGLVLGYINSTGIPYFPLSTLPGPETQWKNWIPSTSDFIYNPTMESTFISGSTGDGMWINGAARGEISGAWGEECEMLLAGRSVTVRVGERNILGADFCVRYGVVVKLDFGTREARMEFTQ